MFKFCIFFYRSYKRKLVYRLSLKVVNSLLESVRWWIREYKFYDVFDLCGFRKVENLNKMIF